MKVSEFPSLNEASFIFSSGDPARCVACPLVVVVALSIASLSTSPSSSVTQHDKDSNDHAQTYSNLMNHHNTTRLHTDNGFKIFQQFLKILRVSIFTNLHLTTPCLPACVDNNNTERAVEEP